MVSFPPNSPPTDPPETIHLIKSAAGVTIGRMGMVNGKPAFQLDHPSGSPAIVASSFHGWPVVTVLDQSERVIATVMPSPDGESVVLDIFNPATGERVLSFTPPG